MNIVSYDEIKVGDKVTLLRWLSHKDRSWVGDLMTVKAKDYPFVVVSGDCFHGNKSHTFHIQDVVFGKPSEDFVKAVS